MIFKVYSTFLGKLKKEIKTETKILVNLIIGILKTPLTIVKVLQGEVARKEIIKPYKDFLDALIQPIFTTSMIFILFACYVVSVFIPAELFEFFIFFSEDIFSTRMYTLITHGFLHANPTHLFGNLLILFIFGRIVEKQLGHVKTAAIYFTALIIAALLSGLINIIFLQTNPGAIGASGAIMGLVSAGILLKPFTLSYGLLFPLPVIVIGWLAIAADISGILQGLDDNIGRFAHLGGFLSIFITLIFLEPADRTQIRRGFYLNVLTLLAFVASSILLLYF